jgi:hypothetical protein
MHLTGRVRRVASGVLERLEIERIGDARLALEAVFTDESFFRECGTMQFSDDNVVRLRTLGIGHLSDSLDPALRYGTVIWDIDGGSGRFSGATGRICSNFTVTREGDIDDEQIGLIFLDPGSTQPTL